MRNTVEGKSTFSYRHGDVKEWGLFLALCRLNRETATGVLRRAVKEYIDTHRRELEQLLE